MSNVSINFEKDFAVYSADPRIVKDGSMINELSYNEARLAATFGMKILDPIAIKEIHECGAEMKLVVSNIKNPKEFTSIYRVCITICFACNIHYLLQTPFEIYRRGSCFLKNILCILQIYNNIFF